MSNKQQRDNKEYSITQNQMCLSLCKCNANNMHFISTVCVYYREQYQYIEAFKGKVCVKDNTFT